MREFVRKQLEKCNYIDLSNYDPDTCTYHIPKYAAPIYELNKCYLVQLRLEIVNNTSTLLAANWNKNTAPKDEYLKIYVSKMLGKMIYVESIGFDKTMNTDTSNIWSGWLDIGDLTQIAKI